MGNCQAAEAATVIIEHPGGKVERIYWSVGCNEIMRTNPGHYVAVLIATIPSDPERNGMTVKQLKLLRPDDTLHIGHVYRLVSFEEVLKEFSGKKYAKLCKIMSTPKRKERSEPRQQLPRTQKLDERSAKVEGTESWEPHHRLGSSRVVSRHSQWRPALQSIDEVVR